MRRKFILALLSLPFVNKLVADQYDSGEPDKLPEIKQRTEYYFHVCGFTQCFWLTSASPIEVAARTPHERNTAHNIHLQRKRDLHARNYGMNHHSQEK